MSDTKWTPGPWSVINRGEPTLQVNHVTAWYVDNQPKAEDPVAVVYFAGMQEGAANARLIAAAPDLYESCKALAVEADRLALLLYGENRGDSPALLWARDAIANAEGA